MYFVHKCIHNQSHTDHLFAPHESVNDLPPPFTTASYIDTIPGPLNTVHQAAPVWSHSYIHTSSSAPLHPLTTPPRSATYLDTASTTYISPRCSGGTRWRLYKAGPISGWRAKRFRSRRMWNHRARASSTLRAASWHSGRQDDLPVTMVWWMRGLVGWLVGWVGWLVG